MFGNVAEPPCLNVLLGSCQSEATRIIAEMVLQPAFDVSPRYTFRPRLVSSVERTTRPPFTLTTFGAPVQLSAKADVVASALVTEVSVVTGATKPAEPLAEVLFIRMDEAKPSPAAGADSRAAGDPPRPGLIRRYFETPVRVS